MYSSQRQGQWHRWPKRQGLDQRSDGGIKTLQAESDESKLPLIEKDFAAAQNAELKAQLGLICAAVLLRSADKTKCLIAATLVAQSGQANTKTVWLEYGCVLASGNGKDMEDHGVRHRVAIQVGMLRYNFWMIPTRNFGTVQTFFSIALAGVLAMVTPANAEEVPFVTSPDNVTLEMLNMAGVKRGDHVLDLGSGDGRIVILAAKRFGATGLGVELDPALVRLSNTHARNAGVAQRAEFREQDLFKTDLSSATVITMYLLPEVNLQLRPALLALKPGTRLVSHDWDMGDWAPDRTTVLPVPDKKVGFEKSSKVHLWVVPARLDGLWCGTAVGTTLRLAQKYQAITGTLALRDRSWVLVGQISGTEVRALSGWQGALALQARGDGELRVASSRGELALARGQTFRRASADSCK